MAPPPMAPPPMAPPPTSGNGRSLPGEQESAAQGVQRTLRALTLLGRSSEGLTISEMAVELRSSRPSVYRMVAALQAGGFALRGDDGRVRLGVEALDLARQVYPVLRSVATPVLRDLADRAGATAHLTVVADDEALAVAVVEPTRTDLHVAYRTGTRHRLDRGAAGRAILAWRESRTNGGTTAGGGPNSDAASPPETDEPRWIRSEGELQSDARGIAAAVRGVHHLEASLGVVCLKELDEDRIGPLVVGAADELAALLNHGREPSGTRS